MPSLRSSVPALAVALTAALVAPAAGQAAAKTIAITGTAYEFNNVGVKLAGARVSVAENPSLRAVVAGDGRYTLRVPASATITPYIEAPGYRRIHLQTFRTAGRDLEHVNFQVPTLPIYGLLAALLSVPLDAAHDPSECAIVTTFSTRNVRGVPFAAFTGYGAHGVAGASAAGTPALPAPVYFNESVIPDVNQQLSSKDGGIVWTRVPAGVYTITASSPSTRFAPMVATCEPGRVVNASPPWGLHELGLANAATARAAWSGPRLRRLGLRGLPPGAQVVASCQGRRCPVAPAVPVSVPNGAASVDVAAKLGARGVALATGQSLVLTVTAPAYDGVELRWTARGRRAPKATKRCIPLGDTASRSCADARAGRGGT